jgi:hypothetical protein
MVRGRFVQQRGCRGVSDYVQRFELELEWRNGVVAG